jgi:hypothetical protein
MAPFIHLIQKDKPFSWGIKAFQYLKTCLMIARFFIHINLSKPFVFETNVFNFEICAILS